MFAFIVDALLVRHMNASDAEASEDIFLKVSQPPVRDQTITGVISKRFYGLLALQQIGIHSTLPTLVAIFAVVPVV